MKFAQLFILLLAFLIINPANAGVLIEPVAGYTFAKADDENANGASIGGRLGYQNFGFQLGLDYLRSSIDVNDDAYKENLTISEFGAFVGYEFPIMLRVYAGYIFQANASSKVNTDLGLGGGAQDYKVEYDKGTGSKVGIGFTGLPFVDINFEYRKGTLTDGKLESYDIEDDLDYTSYMVGISLPFVL